MRYPQQLGRSWKVFVPEPSSTSFATCTGYISNSVCYLHRNHPELQPSGTLQNLVCTRTLRNFISHLHRNPPESCLQSGTLSAICTGTLRNLITHLHRNPVSAPDRNPPASGTSSAFWSGTLRNLVCYLHQNALEPHPLSAPELSGTFYTGPLRNLHRNPGTSSAICTRTFQNLVCNLHQNSPEPHQPSAPEPSGTSSAICTGTLRNLISHLHRKALEPSGTFSGTWCCSCTGSHQSYSGLKTPLQVLLLGKKTQTARYFCLDCSGCGSLVKRHSFAPLTRLPWCSKIPWSLKK